MVKNKLHIIGCSFSTHRFFDLEPGDYPNDPSNYARIVASNLNLEPVGYAREGQGNPFMLNCLKQNRDSFSINDIVLIQMSHPERLFNTIPHFSDVKIVECFDPVPALCDAADIDAEDFKNFAYVYDKCFRDDIHIHDLYCNAIVAECLALPCKIIILPIHNTNDYIEKFKHYDKLAFCTSPWSYWPIFHEIYGVYNEDGNSDDCRFDHLDDEYHSKCGHQIIKDLKNQGLIEFFENV